MDYTVKEQLNTICILPFGSLDSLAEKCAVQYFHLENELPGNRNLMLGHLPGAVLGLRNVVEKIWKDRRYFSFMYLWVNVFANQSAKNGHSGRICPCTRERVSTSMCVSIGGQSA